MKRRVTRALWRFRFLSARQRRALALITALVAASAALTACTFSFLGGIGGITGALILGTLLALSVGSATTGCSEPCLSPRIPDGWRMDACLSSDVGPQDQGNDAGLDLHPCLSGDAPVPDAPTDIGADGNSSDSKTQDATSTLTPKTLNEERRHAARKLTLPNDIRRRI